jgi:hypothetical protein
MLLPNGVMKLTLACVAGLVLQGAALAGEGCKCRANGQAFEQGMIICIRGQLSRCSMNQNVPSWTTLADQCPEAALQSPRPVLQAALPAQSSAH